MTLRQAIEVLVRGDGYHMPIIDTQGLRTLFHADNDAAFNGGLRRLVECGLIERISRGVYINHGAGRMGREGIAPVVSHLRPGHISYLSYEFALSDVGAIGQIPLVYTLATTGPNGRLESPYGEVDFTHTSRSMAEIVRRTVFDDRFNLLFAPPDMALEDLRRSRPEAMHLVDLGDHAEILAEWREYANTA